MAVREAPSGASRVDSLDGVTGKLSCALWRCLLDLLDARAADVRGIATPRSAVPTVRGAALLADDPPEPFEHPHHARYLPGARVKPQQVATRTDCSFARSERSHQRIAYEASWASRFARSSLAGCSTSARTRLAMNLALRTGSPVRVTSVTSTTPRAVVTSTRRPALVARISYVREPSSAATTTSTRSPFIVRGYRDMRTWLGH